MRIDLTKDATDLRGLIVDAVAKYATKHALRAAASHHPLVTRIDLNFWLGDGGPAAPFVPLHFDTRPGSEPDGKWSHPEFATLERPHWKAAVDAVCDGNEIEITAMDRSTQRLDGSNLERTFGDPFIAVLKSARTDGTFGPLPRAAHCELGVEESGGGFGWPHYKNRGVENLV